MLQIEVSGPTDPIMRRLHADREEKRVTRGNVTNPEQDGLTPHSPIREDSKRLWPCTCGAARMLTVSIPAICLF